MRGETTRAGGPARPADAVSGAGLRHGSRDGGSASAGHRRASCERGSASLLILGLVTALLAFTLLTTAVTAALIARQRVAGAADAAALAAADTILGIRPGEPCRIAAETASANRVMLEGCRVDGSLVTVETGTLLVGIRITASATAGPPH